MYVLFIFSISIQFHCYSKDFFYMTNVDFISSFNSSYYNLLSFRFDNLSCSFSTVTVQIAFFANIYSYYYNKYDCDNSRFFILLNLFFLSMVYLLHSGSFVNLFFF